MTTRVLIVDYNDNRRKQLRDLLKASFDDYAVRELETSSPIPRQDTDARKLAEIRTHNPDLLIGHIGGNPSGYECLKAFKDHNPKGKAVLYTKQEAIPLDKFDGLKRANALFKRSNNDEVLFENAVDMMDVIRQVMEEPSIVFWRSPFKEPQVLTTISGGLVLLIISLAADLTQLGQLFQTLFP